MNPKRSTRLSIFVSLVLVLSQISAPALAQRKSPTGSPKRNQTAKTPPKPAPEFCEIWSGKIEVRKNRSETHTKVTAPGQHISDQHYSGTNEQKFTFTYQATFDVADSRANMYEDGSKLASLRGTIAGGAARVDSEKDNWKTQTDCFPDTPRLRVAGKSSSSVITEGGNLAPTKGDGVISIKGNRFTISFGVPEIQGTRTHRTIVKPFGWCMMEENPSSDTTDEGVISFSAERVEVEGQIDPQNPNLVTNSFKPDEETTITWNLTRRQAECDTQLRIEGLQLAHHVFPNATDWEEIGDKTVDGNQVRITARVVNESKKPKTSTVTFKEAKSGLEIGQKPVSVAAESAAEVEFVWDTNGFAWDDARKNASRREVEATLSNGESEAVEVVVVPKPVILVHGLWSNAAAWGEYHNYLEEAHSFAWKAFAVGADPANGKMDTGDHFMNTAPTNSLFQNAGELGKQIRHTQQEMNAWHVDIVAHSMGGLISRFYIHHLMKDSPDGKPVVAHLVMLGTPNQGSPWADIMFDKFKNNGHHVEALRELKTDVVRTFNGQVTNRNGVKFSIIYTDRIPATGNTTEPGDGVVSVSSAIWQIADVSKSASLEHTALTGKADFMNFVYPRLAVGPGKAK